MPIANYLRNKIADHVMRGVIYTPPAYVRIALYTSATDADLGGTQVTGGGYAPAQIGCSLSLWCGTQGSGSVLISNGSGGLISNNVSIPFGTPTTNWGIVTHARVFDPQNNPMFYGPLEASYEILAGGDALQFNPGQFKLLFQ